jgi:AcrR family transcriptional regulator
MTVPASSLRERSKAKRREAIQRVAMRLFAEQGYDGTTIAEIAEAAEVAPRTVSMYFPTKLDIALAASDDMAARLTVTFLDHPELSFTEVIDRWLIRDAESMDPQFAALMLAMFETNPHLRAVSTTHLAETTRVSGPALIAEIGLPSDDPMVTIVSAAVGAVLTEYLSTALISESTQELHHSLMRYLRAIITAARPA